MLDYGISYTTLIHKISEYSLWEKSRSAIEAEVAAYLDSLQIIYSQNCRNLIAPLEVDFLISEKKTAIEINGLYWHSELAGKDRKYHANKQKQVNAVDHKLIMLYDYEWVQKKDIIKSILNSKLGIQRRIFARKTTKCNLYQCLVDGNQITLLLTRFLQLPIHPLFVSRRVFSQAIAISVPVTIIRQLLAESKIEM